VDQSQSSRTSDQFPSWSWLGWKGEIESCSAQYPYEPRSQYLSLHHGSELQPTVKWHILSHPGRKPIQVGNWWHSYHAFQKDSSIPLPQGWSRIETDASTNGSDSRKDLVDVFIPRPTTAFYHESLGNICFRYPFLFHSLLLKLPWKRGYHSSRSLHRGVDICLVIVSTQLLTSTGHIVYSSACKTAMEMGRHY